MQIINNLNETALSTKDGYDFNDDCSAMYNSFYQ